MTIRLKTIESKSGECLPLVYGTDMHHGHLLLDRGSIPRLLSAGVGSILHDAAGQPLFMISRYAFLSSGSQQPCAHAILKALAETPSGNYGLEVKKTGFSLASVTLSDKSAQGLRQDMSGPLIVDLIGERLPLAIAQNFLLPDNLGLLKALLADLAFLQKYDLIVTTGGTGVGQRDVTPQATASVLDYQLPGFMQAMMQNSLSITPHAMISRALAGVAAESLVLNLPGSAKAVKENLLPVLPALEHALKKIRGDSADCGG